MMGSRQLFLFGRAASDVVKFAKTFVDFALEQK